MFLTWWGCMEMIYQHQLLWTQSYIVGVSMARLWRLCILVYPCQSPGSDRQWLLPEHRDTLEDCLHTGCHKCWLRTLRYQSEVPQILLAKHNDGGVSKWHRFTLHESRHLLWCWDCCSGVRTKKSKEDADAVNCNTLFCLSTLCKLISWLSFLFTLFTALLAKLARALCARQFFLLPPFPS